MAEGERCCARSTLCPAWLVLGLTCPAHRTQDGLYLHEHHTPALPASHSWVREAP